MKNSSNRKKLLRMMYSLILNLLCAGMNFSKPDRHKRISLALFAATGQLKERSPKLEMRQSKRRSVYQDKHFGFFCALSYSLWHQLLHRSQSVPICLFQKPLNKNGNWKHVYVLTEFFFIVFWGSIFILILEKPKLEKKQQMNDYFYI